MPIRPSSDPRLHAVAVLRQVARVRSPSPELVRAAAALYRSFGPPVDDRAAARLAELEAEVARLASVVRQLDTLSTAERALFGGGG